MSPSRRKVFWSFAVAFATLVGLFSGLVALLPGIGLTLPRSIFVLMVCASVSAAYAWRESRKIHLPLEEIEPGPRCRLQCPADRSLAEQSHALAAESYGRVEPINYERYEQWRLKNPNILVCLLDEDKTVVGYFDIIPVTDDFAQSLINGIVTEHDLLHEHIVEPNRIDDCKWLYLAGIAVKDPDTFLGRRRAAYLIWGLKMYLRDYYSVPPERSLVATGASAEGEHLLKRFRFVLGQGKGRRADKQNLYVTSLANKAFVAQLAGISDWRNACRVGWRKRSSRKAPVTS
jgi:hypothetical protein